MKWRLAGIALMAVTVWAQPPGGPGGPPPGGPPGAGPGGAMGDGVWQRNAAFGELETFDLCNGHQPGTGMYHHHINPVCLRAQLSDNVVAVSTGRLGTQYAEQTANWSHSPILGWAFDGYPVYGPYGYSDPMDPTSLTSSESAPVFNCATSRSVHTLPDWVTPVPQRRVAKSDRQSIWTGRQPAISARPLRGRLRLCRRFGRSRPVQRTRHRHAGLSERDLRLLRDARQQRSSGVPLHHQCPAERDAGSRQADSARGRRRLLQQRSSDAGRVQRPPASQFRYDELARNRMRSRKSPATDPSAGPSTTWPANAPSRSEM